jgi:hypothetical protein
MSVIFNNMFDGLNFTDQPGRVLAVFVFGPLLIYKSQKYGDFFLLMFGVLLIVWDLFWLLNKPAKQKLITRTNH